jgi:O-antigen ligase
MAPLLWVLVAVGIGAGIAAPLTLVQTLALALSGGLGAYGLTVFRPSPPLLRGLLWVGLLAPLSTIDIKTREEFLGQPVTSLVIVQSLVSVFALVVVLASTRSSLWPRNGRERWLWIYLLIAVLSTAWSILPVVTLLKAGQLVVFYLLILLLIRRWQADGIRAIDELALVVWSLLLVALIEALLVPDQAFTAVSPFGSVGHDPTRRLRGLVPWMHPDMLGYLAVAGIVLIFARAGPRWGLRVRWLLAGLFFGILVLSRTRGALVLLPIALGVLFFFLRGRRTAGWVTAGCAALAIIAFVFLGRLELTEHFLLRQDPTQVETLSGRTVKWEQAIRTWRSRPITGYGFYAAHRTLFERETLTNADSLWLESLMDTGILGTIPLLALVIGSVPCVWRGGPARKALFVLFLGASFVNPSLDQPQYTSILFAFILLANSRAARVQRSGSTNGSVRWNRWRPHPPKGQSLAKRGSL